jgi:hypothetical protein
MNDDRTSKINLKRIKQSMFDIVGTMASDFNFNTRCGDIMMERFDYCISSFTGEATRKGIKTKYIDHEITSLYEEYNIIVQMKGDERLSAIKKFLKKLLNDIESNTSSTLTDELYSQCILLHTIMGTLDLHYNVISNMLEILTQSQINKQIELYTEIKEECKNDNKYDEIIKDLNCYISSD